MRHDGEAERGRAGGLHLAPAGGGVGGAKDTVVMLDPHRIRRAGTLRQPVHILRDGIVFLLGRHVGRPHSFALQAPGLASISRSPHPAGRYAEPHGAGIARVDADGVDAGQIGAAAEPHLALGVIPERTDELPARAAIARAKEPARERAAPQETWLLRAARLERPDLVGRPWDYLAGWVFFDLA